MKRFLLLLLVTASALGSYAQRHMVQNYYMADLNGNWRFAKGDNLKWAKPNFNAGDWTEVLVPSWDWEENYQGYGWYRKDLVLPEKASYFFSLGQVDDNCEVYFNGQLINLYDNPKPSAEKSDTSIYSQWKKYRSYYIPAKLVNAKKNNTIAVRVWNTGGGEGGIRRGNIYVGSTVFQNQLPLSMAGEWLKTDGSNKWMAGLYNNRVIYRDTVWQYGEITHKDEFYDIDLVMPGKGIFKHLLLIQDDSEPGVINYAIGPDKDHMELCKVKETDKPTTQPPNNGPYVKANTTPGRAVYGGYIKNFNMRSGNEATIQLQKLYGMGEMNEKRIVVNPDGSFATTIDLQEPALISLHLPGINASAWAYIEPNKSTFLSVDPAEFKIYVTEEYYTRQRLTMAMGDLSDENRLMIFEEQLSSTTGAQPNAWNKFMYTATRYAENSNANMNLVNYIVTRVANDYGKYNDTAALKKAKVWSARTLLTEPGNHLYNSTFNTVLQNLGEHLEGLQYLVKALDIAEKDKNQAFINEYKQKIKKYVGEMLQ
jgi:hypothetical protein